MTTRRRVSFDRKFVPLSTRFDHALLFAAQVHREQDRKKSGIPYISHLLGVASIVLDYGGDEDMAIAALLHDAVEDHGGRPMLKMIAQIFGPRVSKIVDGCTDSYVEDPKKKENWERRKIRYLHRVRHEDADTRFVSAADKLYNARAVLRDLRNDGDAAFEKFSAPKSEDAVVLPLAGARVSRARGDPSAEAAHRRPGSRGHRGRAPVGDPGVADPAAKKDCEQAEEAVGLAGRPRFSSPEIVIPAKDSNARAGICGRKSAFTSAWVGWSTPSGVHFSILVGWSESA